MDNDAKFARVIRINVVGGTLLLAALALSVVLMAVGFLPTDAREVLTLLVFGGIPMLLLFATVWLARKERARAQALAQSRTAASSTYGQ